MNEMIQKISQIQTHRLNVALSSKFDDNFDIRRQLEHFECEMNRTLVKCFQKNHPTEFGSGEVGDMGGRPPTDDFFLRKLRLSLEDFPDPDGEKNHKLLTYHL